MNIKVWIVVLAGLLGMVGLILIPPWELGGDYRGHSSIFNTAFMSIDMVRLVVEEGVVLLATLVLSIVFWRKAGR